MKKPKSKNKETMMPDLKPAPLGDSLPANPHAVGLPTTEQLAMIAATLAQYQNERPDILTFRAMDLWESAKKRKLNNINYLESYGESGFNSPTHEQLAMLAVNLARSIDDDPKQLVEAAKKIWFAAGSDVDDTFSNWSSVVWDSEQNSIFTHADCDESGQTISRDKFFKGVLPQSKRNRSYESAKVAKSFIRHLFQQQFNKEPNDEEMADYYAKWNAGNLKQANKLFWYFQTWYDEKIRDSRRLAGKRSADAKKKLKKKL